MTGSLEQFGDHQRSEHASATAIINIGTSEHPDYGLFLYSHHKLYKVLVVGSSVSKATEIADHLAVKLSSEGPAAFVEWVEGAFPGEIHNLTCDVTVNLLN